MPSASDPVSPMKMSAGNELNHRKPMHAPASAAAKMAGSSMSERYAMAAITIITIITVPAASPSRPSVRFTALHMPTSRMFTNSRYSHGMAMPSPTGTTVVRTPMSSVHTKGISTVGSTPSRFTATRRTRVAMANWPTSFAFGVRPSERSFTTFEASSTKPQQPREDDRAQKHERLGRGLADEQRHRHHGHEHDDAAHGGRALLHQVALGAVGAHLLADVARLEEPDPHRA